MGQALYRKYRPKSLTEVVGQEHVTETLASALKDGRISHAYLFSGPRGVGKTTIARILAHQINELPYSDDGSHMDIIEIDAASNNSVEDVRDLREKVFIAPTSAKYKVYIIDEVHMLSKAAFNALLKTLEEPPAHVVFILATTETHKLPDTIISRTQHYTFKAVDQPKVIDHLRSIADAEGMKIDDDALSLLAAHGGGSFRDSISVLDQARGISRSDDKTTVISGLAVRQLLGIAPEEAILGLLAAIGQSGQAAALLTNLSQMYGQGLQAAAIANQLSTKLRGSLVDGKPLLPVQQLLPLMKTLLEVPASRNPDRLLEIVLLEAADTSTMPVATPAAVLQTQSAPQPSVKPVMAVPKPAAAAPTPEPPRIPEPVAEVIIEVPAIVMPPAGTAVLDAALWPQVLGSIKKEYNTLYGVLRMAQPIFTPGSVELQFKFLFHQKRLNEVKNKKIIADYIKQLTGDDIAIVCTFNKAATPSGAVAVVAAPVASVSASAEINTISDIFGGGEVLS